MCSRVLKVEVNPISQTSTTNVRLDLARYNSSTVSFVFIFVLSFIIYFYNPLSVSPLILSRAMSVPTPKVGAFWCARHRTADLEISSWHTAYVGFNALKFVVVKCTGPLLISELRWKKCVEKTRTRARIIMRRIARKHIVSPKIQQYSEQRCLLG